MSTNPFLSFAAEVNVPETSYDVFQRNPFASFGADQNASTASDAVVSNPFLNFVATASTENEHQPTSNANPFVNFFATENIAPVSTSSLPSVDPVSKPAPKSAIEASHVKVGRPSATPPPRPPPPSQPGSRSGSRRSSFNSDCEDAAPPLPRRPPPPRSSIPKETEDLILSVTGTLQATSSDLLDRLQATRTPSPTPLEELHSPGSTKPTTTAPDGLHYKDDRRSSRDVLRDESASIFDAIASLSKSVTDENEHEKPPLPPPPSISSHPKQIPPSRPPPPPLPVKHIENDLPADLLQNHVVKSEKSSEIRPPPDIVPTFGLSAALPSAVTTRKTSYDFSSNRPPSSSVTGQKKYSLDHSAFGDLKLDDSTMTPALTAVVQDQTSVGGTTSGDGSNTFDSKTTIGSIESMNRTSLDFTSDFVTDGDVDKSHVTAAHSEESSTIFDDVIHPPLPPVSPPLANASHWSNETDRAHVEQPSGDTFDAFEEKFDNFKIDTKRQSNVGLGADPFDPFGGTAITAESGKQLKDEGFGAEATFDDVLALDRRHSKPVDDPFQRNSSQVQQPLQQTTSEPWPAKRASLSTSGSVRKPSVPRGFEGDSFAIARGISTADSTETPTTPLFDDDVSQPLEPFPRSNYTGPGWNMQIRYPIRKKFTGQRFWKKVFVRLVYQGETPHLELLSQEDSKQVTLHEWPLQPTYAISDIGAQQYDQFGKIFTVKIQFVMYKERPGVRPGQITKAERLTNKLSQFATYAIQGDYQGVKEFGSDLKKLGLPVEHSPQITLICKLGSHDYEDMKQFSVCVEDALFKLSAHRENIRTGINYKMEEMQITAVDELFVEQNSNGSVTKQLARVRLFFLGFLTGMPDVEIGVNDLRRQGKEIVGRHDIIPVITEEWIRLENVEFHECIQQNVYEITKTIKLKPPDACYLELMRFRVRPPKNRELPIQLKTVFKTCGNKVDIAADIIVPGFTSRKLGQIPCEDVTVRIPIPESWIYLFRVEKHFRYGSVKSAHRRTGKVKGIERFLGAVDTLESHLIEVTSGHAKYEHHHRAIVWRIARLPKDGQGAYTTHNLACHLALTSYDQIPDELAKHCFVEFTMPITQVSHMTVRSVSISNTDSDSPPEKYVRHLARHEYRVEIEHTQADTTNDYIAATMIRPSKSPAQTTTAKKSGSVTHSDTDSD